MAAGITDLMDRVTDSTTGRPVIGALAAPGKAIAAASINLSDVTNWTTASAIHFSIYKTMVVGGVTVKDPTTQTDWKGVLVGSTIGSLTITGGTDRAYVAGDIVELTPTARYAKDLYELLITLFNQDASLKPGPIQTALGLGAGSLNGWNALGYAPSGVTANGNRSYDLVFSGVDLSSILSAGMRLRTTRTVAAPNQCTNLNGTTQFYNRASGSVAGMTFTDDFTVSGWIKLTSYQNATIASRYNGTSGWTLVVLSTGQVQLAGFNAGAANVSYVQSYQAVPLNKWVHITAQLDMSTFTATPTTSYVMFDGVDIPATVTRGGTNPVALVQAGNLEIGSQNGGGLLFPGKIAQVAIYNAKVTQATIRTSISQGLVGTETSLISAYSFNNSINDLNVNANNLTANGAAVATTADSPFGSQADGTISTTLDYGIVMKVVFSANTTVTLQLPEGCAVPTSGGVTSVVYSTQKAPFGMPISRGKWRIENIVASNLAIGTPTGSVWLNPPGAQMSVPTGDFLIGYRGIGGGDRAASGRLDGSATLSTANNTELDFRFTSGFGGGVSTFASSEIFAEAVVNNSAATIWYINLYYDGGAFGARTNAYLLSSLAQGRLTMYAECAHL